MTGRPGTVGFYGLLGSGNLGNDASLAVFVDYLRSRHPDVVLDALCDRPAGVTRAFGIPATRLHWNRTEYQTAASPRLLALKAIGKLVDVVRIGAWVRRHDVVVMAGMGGFETTLPLRPWGTPYSQFLVAVLGRLLGVPVVFVGVGANVATNPATRWLFVNAARALHHLSYRDGYSRDAMRQMGLADRGEPVHPDLVHAMATPQVSPERTGVVGVGVLDYRGSTDDRDRAEEIGRTYRASIVTVVRGLLDTGRTVRLFPGDQADQVMLDAVVDDVRRSHPAATDRLLVDPVPTLEVLLAQMAGVDVVIGTRYHNIIGAVQLARPTISIGYGGKHDAVMADAGLAAFCHRADGFDAAAVLRDVEELDARRDDLVPGLREHARHLAERVDEQFAQLDAAVFDPVFGAVSGTAPDTARPARLVPAVRRIEEP